MKVFTFNEFKAWILAQPDERKVDMYESAMDIKQCPCGCLMVQFARENKIDCYGCGVSAFYGGGGVIAHINDCSDCSDFIKNMCDLGPKTFGEVKKHLL